MPYIAEISPSEAYYRLQFAFQTNPQEGAIPKKSAWATIEPNSKVPVYFALD